MYNNSREFKEKTSFKCSYEDYMKCSFPKCDNKSCPHREAFRRLPLSTGGLGLCPNLSKQICDALWYKSIGVLYYYTLNWHASVVLCAVHTATIWHGYIVYQ